MTIRAFDLDTIFSRPASPFAVDEHHLHRRADLFEHVTVARMRELLTQQGSIDIDVLDGAVLLSAILFGALLDDRYWAEWLSQSRRTIVDVDATGAATHEILRRYEIKDNQQWRADSHGRTLSAGRVWLDLQPDGLDLRRWVADPLTHCLMLHWRDRRASTGREPAMPAVAVGAFLRIAHQDQAWQEKILAALGEAATLKWRMRMPGFLVDMLRSGGDGAVLPPQRWLALLGQPAVPIVINKRKVRPPRARQTNQDDEARRCIMQTLPAHRASGRAAFIAAANQLATAVERNFWLPVERLVLLWAADRLDPRRDRRQRPRPLAPSTIERRTARLLVILRGAFGSYDPQSLDASDVAARFNAYLASTPAKASDAAHLRCWADWMQRREPRQSIVWTGGAPKSDRVDSGILTAAEYELLLARFNGGTANGTMARLLVILGFRAGLRWTEAISVRTSDLKVSDQAVELTVRNNTDYLTKSPAGRRIVPLHCLATEDEQTEVVGWWRDRRAHAAARFDDGDPDAHNRGRLFPRWTATLDRQLGADIVHAIKEITGNGEARFHTLRRSCGSYLLATLALPHDVADASLVPRIEPSLVSHARRRLVAPHLVGGEGGSRDGVRAVGALLGHSGDLTTLRSYMHLHDWLAGIYVARPLAQRGLPPQLVAPLLGMTVAAVERANARAADAAPANPDQVRRRGRPAVGSLETGAVILSRLIGAPPSPGAPNTSAASAASPVRETSPTWQSMVAFLTARTADDEKAAAGQREFATPLGQRTLLHLERLRAAKTRGRSGATQARLRETPQTKGGMRWLSDIEVERLARLYHGVVSLPPRRRNALCRTFTSRYDRPRGVMRVDAADLHDAIDALRLAGCGADEITWTKGPKAAAIKVGTNRRTDRGFLWAMMFAAAVDAAAPNASFDLSSSSLGASDARRCAS